MELPTPSLLPRLPYADVAVSAFREAAGRAKDDPRARQLLAELNDPLLRGHFNEAMVEWARRNRAAESKFVSGSVKERPSPRMPPQEIECRIYTRDGWRCRWCETRVLDPMALRRVSKLYPDLLPKGRTDAGRHGIVLCCSASLDHVVPHSHGGSNSEDNLVTSCWPCQFGRGNDLIDRIFLLDPRNRAAVVDEWDGRC